MPWPSFLPESLISDPHPLRARRLVSHALALAGVSTLVLMSAFAGTAPTANTQVAGSRSTAPEAATANTAPAWLMPAQANLDLEAMPQRPGTLTAAAAPPAAAPALNPKVSLPLWVRTTRDTTLWSTSDAGGV